MRRHVGNLRGGKDSFTPIGSNAAMQTLIEAETPLTAVHACVEQLGHTLSIARNLVGAGKQIDLRGLDAEVGFVCARALDLQPDDGRAVRPALIGLRRDLDTLAAALATRAPPPG
jgi:hypothetical protein